MKYTKKQFQTQYPDDGACLDAILKRQLERDPSCHGCGVTPAKFHRITGRRGYACQDCGHHVFPCVGTIFQHSSTPLTDWFYAMYLMTATRNGVSGKELQRQLGVTYKCAWRIGHQLRILMAARDKATTPEQLSGHVEIDETYVGGVKKTGPNKSGPKLANKLDNKSCVMGMVERGGAFKGHVVPNAKKVTLLPLVTKSVADGSTISTDELKSYVTLPQHGYYHGIVRHSLNEYVRGIHHTNRIEGFWSHLKRGISSTHVSVSRKHLQKYVDEFAFRYNNRKAPADMFARMLNQVSKTTI